MFSSLLKSLTAFCRGWVGSLVSESPGFPGTVLAGEGPLKESRQATRPPVESTLTARWLTASVRQGTCWVSHCSWFPTAHRPALVETPAQHSWPWLHFLQPHSPHGSQAAYLWLHTSSSQLFSFNLTSYNKPSPP